MHNRSRYSGNMSNSIEFQSAMNDFKIMFPDMVRKLFQNFSLYYENTLIFIILTKDSEVIEEILRCNRGSVERTIDQLLSITSDNQVKSTTRLWHKSM